MYCLKPEAKEDTINSLYVIVKLIITILGALTVIGAYTLIGITIRGYSVDNFELITGFLGICAWTTILSLIVISTKRWLQSNIVKC